MSGYAPKVSDEVLNQ
ncbi:hypothetical protein J606_0001, partial [Acinetobacter baumannii 318814]